jgi:hypothetical protein
MKITPFRIDTLSWTWRTSIVAWMASDGRTTHAAVTAFR